MCSSDLLIGRQADDGTQLVYQTIDACIAFMYQLDRTHLVTIEGIQDTGGKLSPVHDATEIGSASCRERV